MRAMEASGFSIESLRLVEKPVPTPRRGEMLVRVEAASLNYRDLVVLDGSYMPDLAMPFVPVSDAAGEVVAIGEDVRRFKPGDRVVTHYIQGWHDGRPTQEQRTQRTLGGPLGGVLQDYIAIPAEDAVALPAHLSAAEAATLPIAAVTAWATLQAGGLKAGDSVLLIGTGGVALFALQFAVLSGARAILLSSSDDKLERGRKLRASAGINYRDRPEWAGAVREATEGRGVDIVVETGGATLPQSLAAAAFGGFVGVVGFVGGMEAPLNVRQLIGPVVRMEGIAVGSRAQFEAMNRAITLAGLHPVIDSSYPLEKAADAFSSMKAGGHFGKIVITF